MPESVEPMVLDSSRNLREDEGWEQLPGYLYDEEALVWYDVSSQNGGQDGPYGRLLSQVFGFDDLTVEDCFTESHLPKVDDYGELTSLKRITLPQRDRVTTLTRPTMALVRKRIGSISRTSSIT